MTPTTYGRDFAYCLKSHGGVRGFYASLWRFLLRCTLFCHSVATFLTSVSSYKGGCGFEASFIIQYFFNKPAFASWCSIYGNTHEDVLPPPRTCTFNAFHAILHVLILFQCIHIFCINMVSPYRPQSFVSCFV